MAVVGLAALTPDRARAQAPATESSSAERRALNLATFDQVWSLVADTHFDPELGGVDWSAARDELRPLAASARDDHELRRILDQMIGRLGQSHFDILPSARTHDAAETAADLLPQCTAPVRAEILSGLEASPDSEGESGLELALVEDDEVLVTRVAVGGPAATLGIATGWRLLAVDGRALAGHLDCLEDLASPAMRRRLVRLWLNGLLDGPPGTETRLRFETGRRARKVEVRVRREAPSGERTGFGNLPLERLHFELGQAETPRGATVSVVRFNLWLLPVASAFERAMPELRRSSAVVIDLRGNPGGVAIIAQGVAGHFVNETTSLGKLRSRRDDLEMIVEPRRVSRDGTAVEPHRGPLAILIDDGSASTSELFAAGLRDHGRARLFGARSAGAALPAITDRLPNGDVFLHASMDYIRPNGEPVEGRPVVPDVETTLRRDDLLAGKDAALAAALDWIDDELEVKP